jgi:hypothetical protein
MGFFLLSSSSSVRAKVRKVFPFLFSSTIYLFWKTANWIGKNYWHRRREKQIQTCLPNEMQCGDFLSGKQDWKHEALARRWCRQTKFIGELFLPKAIEFTYFSFLLYIYSSRLSWHDSRQNIFLINFAKDGNLQSSSNVSGTSHSHTGRNCSFFFILLLSISLS